MEASTSNTCNMERRRISTCKQMEMLLEFAESHKDLALGRLRSKEGRVLSLRLWKDCSEILNTEGPARTPKEWAKVWTDWKSKVRNKLTTIVVSNRRTGGGPATTVTLSPLDERVADIIGRDIGPLPNVAQNPFLQTAVEDAEGTQIVEIEQHEINSSNENVPGPASQSLLAPFQQISEILEYELPIEVRTSPLQPSLPPPPPPQETTATNTRITSPPQSPSSTPSRRARFRRNARPRHRPRMDSPQNNRSALHESRLMVLKIEEMRARNEGLLAEAALRREESIKIAAEADRLRAQTLLTLTQSASVLVPTIQNYLQELTRTHRMSNSTTEDI